MVLTPEDGTWSPEVTASSDGIRLTAVWELEFGECRGSCDEADDEDDEAFIWNSIVQTASSADGGVTWSTPATVAAWKGPDTGDQVAPSPEVASSRDGKQVILLWSRSQPGGTSTIQAARSVDGGITWGSPTNLSTLGVAATSPRVTASEDGMRLTAVWSQSVLHEDAPTEDSIEASSSADGGSTWGAPVTVRRGPHEDLQVTSSSDGARVTAGWWGYAETGGLQIGTSADGGASWGAPVSLPTGTNGWARGLRMSASRDGMGLVASWVFSPHSDGSQPRSSVQATRSADGGATWASPVALSPVGNDADQVEVSSSADGSALTAVWVLAISPQYKVVQAARSTDSGMTWGTPVTLSSADGSGTLVPAPQIVTSRDGARRVASWYLGYVTGGLQASSWPDPVPAITAVGWTNAKATKFRVTITPRSEDAINCDKSFRFRIQKATYVTVHRGSDEPTYAATWRTLKGTYRTTAHGWPKTRVVNLGKGTYRAIVKARCGYAGATSNAAWLVK